VKVVYVSNLSKHKRLVPSSVSTHMYVTSVYQKQFGAPYTTCKRYCDRQHGWCHSVTCTVTFSTTRQYLLRHSLALSVTPTISVNHLLACQYVNMSLSHLLAVSHSHYLNESLARLSICHWVTCSLSVTPTISMNHLLACQYVNMSLSHFLAVSHSYYLNESLVRSQSLPLSQWITCSLLNMSLNHLQSSQSLTLSRWITRSH
jgi:nitrogen-specific signal transduction histidine kinase